MMCFPTPGVPTANWFAISVDDALAVRPDRAAGAAESLLLVEGLFVASVTLLLTPRSPPSDDVDHDERCRQRRCRR